MDTTSAPLEIEVKFYVNDPWVVRERIIALGASSGGRFFESNLRFDNQQGGLFRSGSLLRLRQDRQTTLTHKSRPCVEDTQFKVHRELEVVVSDCNTMKLILEALGFFQVQVYEKWRETFKIGETLLCLDELPFGVFLEIEGTRNSIQQLASDLGLAWEERILDNYLHLFEMIRRELKLSFSDVRFDHFLQIRGDFAAIIKRARCAAI